MHPSARHARLLACAAVVPVMLVAGCSSQTGGSPTDDAASKSAKPSASPTVAAAKYADLPRSCSTLPKDTVKKLVPKAKSTSGTSGSSADIATRSSCSWNGLDGFQYRWLDVSLQRFDSDPTLGSGQARARDYYGKQVTGAKSAKGAKDLKAGPGAGLGEEATTVRYDLKKDGELFKNQTVVARTGNVVITLNYNGAGYEDAKSPDAEKLLKDAAAATKQVIAAVAKANK